MLDRENACPLLIISPEGGMGIEEISEDRILKLPIDLNKGLTDKNFTTIKEFMNFKTTDLSKEFCHIVKNLYKCFLDNDCTLVEINPLGLTE